jgi:hypothetical protein
MLALAFVKLMQLGFKKMSGIDHFRPACICKEMLLWTVVAAAGMIVCACSSTPLSPYTADATPLASLPGVEDQRGRFREIFCTILEERGSTLPDSRPCEDALTRYGIEPDGTGQSVELGRSGRRLVAAVVPGLGWDCFANWVDVKETSATHVRQFGYDMVALKVEGLSSSGANARQIRDAIMAMEPENTEPHLVLIGYSKGAPDILEAVVSYPEIRHRIAAVVGIAGAIGGSPFAEHVKRSQVKLLRHFPGAECSAGDGGAVESLLPTTRKAWLAENPLPDNIPYYSLVTCPEPERISSFLKRSYKKVGRVDVRNDGMVVFDGQFIPNSTFIGCVNADHWAVAVPVARFHPHLAPLFFDENDYPREALIEAVLRFVEEDLTSSAK